MQMYKNYSTMQYKVLNKAKFYILIILLYFENQTIRKTHIFILNLFNKISF